MTKMKKLIITIIFFNILLIYAVDEQPAGREALILLINIFNKKLFQPLQRVQPTGVRKRQRDSSSLIIGAIKKARSSKKGCVRLKVNKGRKTGK